MATKSFWIKQRENPQLGTYYIQCGQLTVKEAKAKESNTLYGYNIMHRFHTEAEYHAKIAELKASAERIQ